MAEVLLKCVIRETKSIYRKFYEKYKLALFFVSWVTGSCIAGFGGAAFCIWLSEVIQENIEFVMIFVNAIIVVVHAIGWVIKGLFTIIMSGVLYVIALPLWFTGLVVFLMLAVGYPVTKAFIICVKRARKSDATGVS